MKKAVPSVVAAMLKARECRARFMSLQTLIEPAQRAPDEESPDLDDFSPTSNF
jgi:hypothetical protein